MGSASAVVAPVSAQSRAAGHLRVVDAPKFSALPHVVIRDTSLSRDARLLYSVLQMYWWQEGECTASHETLAADMGCSERGLRRYLDELLAAKLIVESAAGVRRSKVYTPASIGQKQPIEEGVNKTPVSDWNTVNRTKPTVQSDKTDTGNRTPLSDSKKKTPVKKTQEEDLPPTGVVVAAVAADQPAIEDAKPKKSKATACPETFPLDAKHFEYAASLGLSEAQARSETSKFLAHHKFKGTRGVDWYAGWQGWMRRAVEYGAPTRTNGNAAPKPTTNGAKGWSIHRD